jgi:hypothetical protein
MNRVPKPHRLPRRHVLRALAPLVDTLAHCYIPHCTPGPSPYAYKRKVQGSRTRRLATRENGPTRKSLALSHADACNPLLQAHPTWAQGNTKAAGFPFACFLPPFVLRLAPTHLGWGTRRQFTRQSRDPPGSKRRHIYYHKFLFFNFYP